MNKSASLFALTGLALSSSLFADEPLPQAQAIEIKPEPGIAICRMPAPVSQMKELKEMEANEESIQSLVQNEETKTTIEKLKAPIVLKSMGDANKHLTRASMEKISVDFEKEQIVVFAWQGSGQDRLHGYLPRGEKAVANFNYSQGRTKDLKTHTFIYAMPKGTEFKVNQQPQIIRCGVEPMPQREGGPVEVPQVEIQQLEADGVKLQLRIQPKQKAE